MANPQNWNRYSYVANRPVNFSDPTGHCSLNGHWMLDTDRACLWASSNQESLSGNGNGGFVNKEEERDKGLKNMKPGDIITFETAVDGETVTHNYMLGLMEDHETLGFWDLDTHSYVPYEVAATTVDMSDSWTIFKKTDPKTFNSYEVVSSSGTPSPLSTFDYYWAGGVDDNPAYVEIYTQVDWATMPGQLANAVLGPGLVASFWMDAKPTITPPNQAGYFPLTNYVVGLLYFANDRAALSRYPIIHP